MDLGAHERISTGIDSDVYLVGDRVAKEYQRLTFDDVERYAELQNGAAAVLPTAEYSAEISIRGVPHMIRAAEAIPVDDVGLSRSGKPLTLSRYVEGPNLEKIMYRPEDFAAYAWKFLRDPQLRELGFDLNNVFWSEYPTRVQDEFHYHVCMLSRHLDRELGVSGLYISKYNVKLRPVSGARQIDLVVTDLALYIGRIDHRPSGG